jgi:hypothetical protein
MIGLTNLIGLAPALFIAVAPSSTNYSLKSYDFGNGGTDSSSSTGYGLNGDSGLVSGDKSSSTNNSAASGLNPTQNSNVPPAPTLANPTGRYDTLDLVLSTGNNSSDTKYLIAISNNNFVTTFYVQPDHSIASTYTLSTYQTYVTWGGATGFSIVGLTQGTTYEAKVKAITGKFSESAFGPKSAAVATVSPTLSLGLTTSLTATPPFVMNFASLVANSVYTANADVNVSMSTNATYGGTVYIKSQFAGIRSARAAFTLPSATADLTVASSGYGMQSVSFGQTAGGPVSVVAPYAGTLNSIGALSSDYQPILSTPGPVNTGIATYRFKAKTDPITPAENDYIDNVTIIAAMNY